jgi:cytoskeleton protein RodZ
MAETEAFDGQLFPHSVGERLRKAREAGGLDLNDIGTRTRIPVRHLEALERDEYDTLPSPTYALGFTRAFARAVGLEEAPLVQQLRAELGKEDPAARDARPYEPVDPSRVPSKLLVWTLIGLIALFVAGYAFWKTQVLGNSNESVIPIEEPVAAAPSDETGVAQNTLVSVAPAATPANGTVVLTAVQPVWLRIYEMGGKRLFEKEMAAGETYTVPADAVDPRILTGRPDALKVTIAGQEVAALGAPERTIKDVAISAAALAARPPAPTAAASPNGASVTGASVSPLAPNSMGAGPPAMTTTPSAPAPGAAR